MNQQSINPETLDLLYEVTRQGPPNQFREADAIDGKIVQIFGAASVVIGLSGLAQATLSDGATVLLGVAIGSYLVAAASSLVGLWVRRTKRPFHSDTLLADFWQSSPQELKYALVYELPEMHKHNQRILDLKADVVRLAVVATALEVGAIGGMIVWST